MNKAHLSTVVLLSALFLTHAAYAKEIAGLSIPDEAVLEGAEKTLLLNGAGVREKFFLDIYVGALYLEAKTTDAATAIHAGGPKRILLHFVHSEVPAKKLADAWHEGFEANTDPASLSPLKPRIDRFANLFQDAKRGDVYTLDYLPGQGTRVVFNDRLLGIVEGEDFSGALLGIWLGAKPVTEKLKRAMLGGD